MSNPKKFPEDFVPNHQGTQPRKGHGNKGAQMADTSHEKPDYIPPKG
ncbi:acid-soluble spore protein N [Fictibacillus aquaticus]|uniref:Acid-soluble spore protein N n=1 Tax=Fictibacillus aquaticus TaxID=2021314 RepID=A0A235FCQ8_9BACL|nr:acid-soluble spore protein N [Fictibacillus aquaticus]OYD58737.1 acid-soluble spore protein N [Fictibacillus aquaticus]